MSGAISNTSPLVYLHRAGVLGWLPELLNEIWIPSAVVEELEEGRRKGYDAPSLNNFDWFQVTEPRAVPSEWVTLDLGAGEVAAIALALENRGRVLLLDDAFARRIATAAGLNVWETLKVLLEGKSRGLTATVSPYIERLVKSGMWISENVRRRVLVLAGE